MKREEGVNEKFWNRKQMTCKKLLGVEVQLKKKKGSCIIKEGKKQGKLHKFRETKLKVTKKRKKKRSFFFIMCFNVWFFFYVQRCITCAERRIRKVMFKLQTCLHSLLNQVLGKL